MKSSKPSDFLGSFIHCTMPFFRDHFFQDTLNLDGTTDGGCETVSPIDSADKYGKCPTTATATWHRQLQGGAMAATPYGRVGYDIQWR